MEAKIFQLEKKVTVLEARNAQLETQVKEQETILISVLVQTRDHSESDGSKSIFKNREAAIRSTGKSGISRTCRELRAADPTLSSGMQWIDPDGQGVGEDPIYVHCNMTSGSTSILHDSEFPIDVDHCADPGCYSRSINYSASIGQIKSLAELSAECHQSIKYDCYYAPFEFDKIPYAWWNDRDGNAQYFWAGNKTTSGNHTCQCGIDGNCVGNSLKCNCDAAAPIQLVDDGVITDKNVLPITRLNFGRTQLESSSGVHTLGRLVCTGSVAITGFPTSCKDLKMIGHTLNGLYSVMEGALVKNVYCDFTQLPSDAGFQSLIGYAEVKPKPTYTGIPTSCANLKAAGHTSSGLYSVMGAKMVESVYCDFTKPTSNSGFQKWIGYTDVKSAPVYFYVQRNSNLDTANTPIPFDVVRVNEGNAMNVTSGKFTAPQPGIYFISFTGSALFPASTALVQLGVSLYLNGAVIGTGWVEEANAVANQDTPLTLQSTLNLKKGDQLWVQIRSMSSVVYLTDSSSYH